MAQATHLDLWAELQPRRPGHLHCMWVSLATCVQQIIHSPPVQVNASPPGVGEHWLHTVDAVGFKDQLPPGEVGEAEASKSCPRQEEGRILAAGCPAWYRPSVFIIVTRQVSRQFAFLPTDAPCQTLVSPEPGLRKKQSSPGEKQSPHVGPEGGKEKRGHSASPQCHPGQIKTPPRDACSVAEGSVD